jgi:conjugal transfer pilus assembly protein TraL
MEEIDIPRYVDSQYQLFFWELDEIAPIAGMLGLGIVTDTLTLMIVPMFVFARVFSAFKQHHLDGVLLHMAYWAGIIRLNRVFENGLVRCYES